MEKRITKKDNFKSLKELAIANGREDLADFCDHEIELANRKSTSKAQTARQVENEKLKKIIVDTLNSIDGVVTISELQALNSNLTEFNGDIISNQRITNLLTQLVNSNAIDRVVAKGKAHFGKKEN